MISNDRAFPGYWAILGVDAKSFTSTPDRIQPALSDRIPKVLAEAFRRCHLDEAWRSVSLHQDTGDGHVIVLGTQWLGTLVHPLPDALQTVLEEEDGLLRQEARDLRLRLRLSLHVGPLENSGTGVRTDGKGRTMNETHRLLDSGPVRAALADSDPDVTLIAALFSERVYQDAIVSGWSEKLKPSWLTSVQADVPGKDFAEQAWLYVPKPSHLRASATDQPRDGSSDTEEGQTSTPAATSGHGNQGNVAINVQAGRDFRQSR